MRNSGLRVLALVIFGGVFSAAQTNTGPQRSVASLEQQVQEYLRAQKPQLAIPLLREIVAIEPANVNAQNNLGVLLFFDNRYSEALPHLRAAFETRSDSSRIQGLLGIAEKRTGNPTDAQANLERAFPNLDDQKFRIQVGLELIELESASGQMEKALGVVRQLQEIGPRDPQIILAAYELARRFTDQSLLNMIAAAPDSAEMHMMMASELARQGDHTNAIAQFREAIRLKPALPGVHFELGEELRTSPDAALNAQAEAEYVAAVRANPYDELSWRQLAGLKSAKSDFKAAEEDYRKALALRPQDSDAETGLAIVVAALNRNEEAIKLLESAIKDDPTNITAHFRLSNLYRRMGKAADADRELEAFHHYQGVKEKLGRVFRQMAAPGNPM